MSSLWTPGGEHPIGRESTRSDAGATNPPTASRRTGSVTSGTDDGEELTQEEAQQMEQRLEELREQLVSTPAEVVVANHLYGLFELAAIHLSQSPPGLRDARLAIDAMAAVVEGLKGRLGEAERPLTDALAQIRLAFVQIGETAAAPPGSSGTATDMGSAGSG